MSDDDAPAEDADLDVTPGEVKDLEAADEDDVKGGFRSTGCRL